MADFEGGRSKTMAQARLESEHPIELVGQRLRALMPWIQAETTYSKPLPSGKR